MSKEIDGRSDLFQHSTKSILTLGIISKAKEEHMLYIRWANYPTTVAVLYDVVHVLSHSQSLKEFVLTRFKNMNGFMEKQ